MNNDSLLPAAPIDGIEHTIVNYVPGPRVMTTNETKALTRNRYETSKLAVRLKQIDKEIEDTEHSRKKELKQIRESMRLVRESTGVTEIPEEKTAKSAVVDDAILKNKSTRSDSTTSYMFNYELINKQAEENYGMLYNSFPIKSLQDPIYQYNPSFLRIKANNSGANSGHSSRLDNIDDDLDNPDDKYQSSMINEDEITIRKGGFKMTFDDSSDEEYNDVQILDKYKKELKKYEDNVMLKAPIEDENRLEEIYDELCKVKASIPTVSKEKINGLKHKDPVFAKRYRQFSAARTSGRVPVFESAKVPIRLAMPRSAIEKRKKEMMQTVETKASLRENPYIDEQQKLNEKVSDFMKNLSVKS